MYFEVKVFGTVQKCLPSNYLVNLKFVLTVCTCHQNYILAIFVVEVLDRSNVFKSSCHRLNTLSSRRQTSVEMVKRALTGDGSDLMVKHTDALWDAV